mgnify:FL=1
MNEEEKKELQNALTAVREAAKAIEEKSVKGEAGLSELKSIQDRANQKLDELEKKNQELVKKNQEELKAAEELKTRIGELETKAAKFGASSVSGISAREELKELERKALVSFARFGGDQLQPEERKYLRSDSNVSGGFLMGQSFDDMILKPITEMSNIRAVATTKRIDALSHIMALRSSLVTSYWTGEGEDFTASKSQYSRPEVPVNSLTTYTEATNQALLGGQWDIESEIMADFAESRMQLEGAGFVNGDGVKKPRGFMAVPAGVPTMKSGDADSYDFDTLILLTGELKTGYNPMFGFNRKELAYIRTLKAGTSGEYAWQPGNMAAGVPNALAGYPYIEIPGMPNRGADLKPVIFADFRRMYTIVDAYQAIMLRNPYHKDGFVKFTLQSFLGGDVVMKEAGVILVCDE